MLIVQKFGGSSLADAERLRRAAGICMAARNRGHSVVMVVSAMGDTTDGLIELAHTISSAPPARELDALMSTGEQRSAALMAITLESMGVSALSLTGWQAGMYTDGTHGDAALELTMPTRISAALRAGVTPVVAGFQGVDIRGDVTTLGRGGSDTSAVALSAALPAQRCEIYTDVNGIYTADPRLVGGARRLSEIDYGDMLLLARGGSQVLNARSVELAEAGGVDIYLLSSAGEPGYSVVRRLENERRPDFAGVTRDTARSCVTLVGKGCRSHTLPELAALLTDAGVSVRGGRMGAGYASVKTDPGQLSFALEKVHEYIFE